MCVPAQHQIAACSTATCLHDPAPLTHGLLPPPGRLPPPLSSYVPSNDFCAKVTAQASSSVSTQSCKRSVCSGARPRHRPLAGSPRLRTAARGPCPPPPRPSRRSPRSPPRRRRPSPRRNRRRALRTFSTRASNPRRYVRRAPFAVRPRCPRAPRRRHVDAARRCGRPSHRIIYTYTRSLMPFPMSCARCFVSLGQSAEHTYAGPHVGRSALPCATALRLLWLRGLFICKHSASKQSQVPAPPLTRSLNSPPPPPHITLFSRRRTQVMAELDKHIVGQKDAKRAVAIALRNRWRRMQLPDDLRTVRVYLFDMFLALALARSPRRGARSLSLCLSLSLSLYVCLSVSVLSVSLSLSLSLSLSQRACSLSRSLSLARYAPPVLRAYFAVTHTHSSSHYLTIVSPPPLPPTPSLPRW